VLEVLIVPGGKLPRKSSMRRKRGNLVNIRHESVGGGVEEKEEAAAELENELVVVAMVLLLVLLKALQGKDKEQRREGGRRGILSGIKSENTKSRRRCR
jgi:hypothetical protein